MHRAHLVALLLLWGAGLLPAASPKTPSRVKNLLSVQDAGDGKITTPAQWEARRSQIRVAIESIMGPLPAHENREPPAFEIAEETDCGTYLRRRIFYQSERFSRVPAYLLIPKVAIQGHAKAPGVLCLHPTDNRYGYKVVVGLGGRPHRQYAAELAQRGCVALAPAYPLLANYQPDLAKLGYTSGSMKAIWDNIRGLDLLESLPYVQKNGFGAIGHSLGGHNALFTAVFDPRIRVVVSSCGFDAFADYMDGDIRGWTSERYMPKLLDYRGHPEEIPFDFFEVLGALAPRPVFISAPYGDSNFKWKSVDRIARSVSEVYALFKAPANLKVVHPDSGHDFPDAIRKQAYAWLERHLAPPQH